MSEQQRSWGPESAGCQLSITTAKTHFRLGEPLNLDIVVRNNGHTTVGLARVSEWFDFEWKTHRPGGGALPLSAAASQQKLALEAGGGGTLLQVPPQQQAKFVVNFADLFNIQELGEIQIQVARKALDDGGSPFEVVSNTISIFIDR
jgi:hypothetical protein